MATLNTPGASSPAAVPAGPLGMVPPDPATRAFAAAILVGPVSAVVSATVYLALGTFDLDRVPTWPAALGAVLAGCAVTLASALIMLPLVRRARDQGRADLALQIAPWSGTAGTFVGAAFPIAMWLVCHGVVS